MSAVDDILKRLSELRRETSELEAALLMADMLDPRLTTLIAALEAELGADTARWWSSPYPGLRRGTPRDLALAGDIRAVAGLAGVPRAHDLRL